MYALTLTSHGYCNVHIYPEFAVNEEQHRLGHNFIAGKAGSCCYSFYLVKSLSTSYS